MIASLLLGLVVGLILGLALAPRPRIEAPVPGPHPLPLPPPADRWRDLTAPTCEALAPHGEATLSAEDLAPVLARTMADGWSLGAGELRDALIASSGLTPALIDEACGVALRALSRRPGRG